ncbi:death-on-curing family protein [Pseudomonas nitritireducens]|uniref:Death-on-curing family protein n=1 Tax=Pseudomonas nitroreducens TaxID=46680 RepID=A0A7W7KL37_PSENT|nr:virulence protein RhuM/Fic/DOC family protein [Pseudomonas nitritireducens]MBB4864328.1 death-on-curing family protein [Pseudomonas nitritireducens]
MDHEIERSILLYQTESGRPAVEVLLEKETLWLSLPQLVELFGRDKSVISRHLKNIFESGELEKERTVAKNATVQSEGKRQVARFTEFYSLDAIISVGYRVNSRQGTHFRIWANQVLKDYLVKGYSLNEQRLKAQHARIRELERTLTLFQENLIDQASLPEAKGLVSVIAGYARTFVLLNQFDSERLPSDGFNEDIRYAIEPDEANSAIAALKDDLLARSEASDLFGRPKDDSFLGVLGNVTQSFGGQFLYPSIEEQAAHLLYFVIKNHPFTDGNKRIGAFLFIWFLQRNRHDLKQDGELKINDNALAAIALLVAQSDPAQKELMIHLIMNLIRN